MVETDWREILSFSQLELGQADKEKLCENLSWMEADDIELNFSDLKTLFRLAQDILKYKSEQVNNLMGKLETANRKSKKGKSKLYHTGSPARTDSVLETIAHQEEEIRANKDILDQLYADIAELEGKKKNLEERNNLDKDSESSRDALSEMDAVVQLENEVAMKNRHIRKLLGDVNVLEDENSKLKEKVSVLKDKLLEATQLIDNLTEQLIGINNECSQLKDTLGASEKGKIELTSLIETLRKENFEMESNRENIYDEIKSKVQHWKNMARTKKAELETLSIENEQLKENLSQVSKQVSSPKLVKRKSQKEELKIKELQDKLIEASNEMEKSACLIDLLRTENRQLKGIIEETPDSAVTDSRNESDDGKQRILINKLKRKVKSLSVSLQGAEEMVAIRESEIAEIASELQLLQSDEGINALLQGLKHNKRDLKVKDEGIKSLVQDVNNMSQLINDLQLENETLRQKFNVPASETISTDGLVKKYKGLEQNNIQMCKEIRRLESKLVRVELENRNLVSKYKKITNFLDTLGYSEIKIEEIVQDSDNNDYDCESESKRIIDKQPSVTDIKSQEDLSVSDHTEIKKLSEENEGLRIGLQEILDFLKDNSKTSSGILALQCPSLEALLRSMEARHTAGWFAPHMATVMELRAAMGGKDALLTALHEARKETFEVMTQLSKETMKSSELERKLHEIETANKQNEIVVISPTKHACEFGSWMSEKDQISININDSTEIENMIDKGNHLYVDQLKKGLEYFHEKFKALYDKITLMAIHAADDNNKWSIQEEQYKAQIESLKGQIDQQDDEDTSDVSPGIISLPSSTQLQRKCSYLEDSYKYIRTLNENIKNENMDTKRQMMTMSSDYETEIQSLILSITHLTDKLRNSVPLDLFWKQNAVLNEITLKYRKVIEEHLKNNNKSVDLLKHLETDKLDIINNFQKQLNQSDKGGEKNYQNVLLRIEESVLKKQVEVLCNELDDKTKRVDYLENINAEIQDAQSKLIDNSLAAITKDDLDLMKNQLHNLIHENKFLKQQCRHVGNELDIALLQLQESQQRNISDDIETNQLRHQIVDLQSCSDNKAIVARLSGEVLVAHLQASESNKKIEQLNLALTKEKELRTEAEEMFKARQKIIDVYAFRYESKFRYMFDVIQVLRQQYQGSIPLASIENYINSIEDVYRETHAINDKLQDIEDLRSSLMAKHSVFDQILDVSRTKCLTDNNSCSHKLQATMLESFHSRELDHINKKLKILEQSRENLIKHCNNLERTFVLVNQGFEKPLNGFIERKQSEGEVNVSLELEDIQSDDDDLSSRKSQTITLHKPQIQNVENSHTEVRNNENQREHYKRQEKAASPVNNYKIEEQHKVFKSVEMQTIYFDKQRIDVAVQANDDREINQLKQNLASVRKNFERNNKELNEALYVIQQKNQETLIIQSEKINLEANIQRLQTNSSQKDKIIEKLHIDIDKLNNELDNIRSMQLIEINNKKDSIAAENKSLLVALKQLENDKNVIVAEYKQLLNNEREEYCSTIQDLNVRLIEMQSKFDRNGSDSSGSNGEALKEVVNKYTVKIVTLENKLFKLQSEFDECRAERTTYQSEVERWKGLATERLTKMEQLNSQLEERHCHEVESYKQETQHWLSQLNDTQKEHMELRSRLTEQKALHVKQMAEKDGQIEHMRSVINNLKAQVMNMQTMISVHDPSFDLSAIVEVDEGSDAMSHSDRLEIKFDSSGELNDDEFGRIGSSSTSIWQEPVIERLRRDKQLVGKQNAILRRQIKALAARERRSRLDAQNLKNQVFRISSSGSRVATAESAALQNKIAMLQTQLTSARRDTHSSIALWDKWKRAQQAADRWQSRFEEKCQEVTKLEASLNLAKSALSRLEREKRVLMTRIAELKGETQMAIEKQDSECAEKSQKSIKCANCMDDAPPLSNHTLLERIQAQQRRIVALTLAEKGNEHLVSEYEKALAEITSLKGQVLKLESTLLESQIRSPPKSSADPQPELEYWKSYCEMLKEENVQLNLRVNSMESVPTTAHQHRINDLEQTILTLRGLVSKLQAEHKSSTSIVHKRVDSRPSSGRSVSEKGQSRLESHRIEIANLKRSIQDKDLLLERSKEMLKIAAEREDELLRENAFLRRQLNDLTKPKDGFLSA